MSPLDDLDAFEMLAQLEALNLPPVPRRAVRDDDADAALAIGPTQRAVAAVEYRDLGEG